MSDTVFYPEPCTACDNGQACETHAPEPKWNDSWLTADDRKGLRWAGLTARWAAGDAESARVA